MSNATAQTHDINVGDELIVTKDMWVAKIHALSRLQQKDVSATQSCPTKVCHLCLLEQIENVFMHWQKMSLHSNIYSHTHQIAIKYSSVVRAKRSTKIPEDTALPNTAP